jgi:Fe-Mn family superoxide dismutase
VPSNRTSAARSWSCTIDKHHRAYVKRANDTLERLAEERRTNDFQRLAALEHALAFNVSGHILHSIFWQNLMPKGGGCPEGVLAKQLDDDFGGFDAFRSQLTRAATTILGSGWAALVWDSVGRKLLTTQIHDHQSEITQAGIPLMVLDAWEHAYYLQYRNEKAKFFEAVWDLWNWQDVAARFAVAQRVDLGLEKVVAATPAP